MITFLYSSFLGSVPYCGQAGSSMPYTLSNGKSCCCNKHCLKYLVLFPYFPISEPGINFFVDNIITLTLLRHTRFKKSPYDAASPIWFNVSSFETKKSIKVSGFQFRFYSRILIYRHQRSPVISPNTLSISLIYCHLLIPDSMGYEHWVDLHLDGGFSGARVRVQNTKLQW